MSGQKYVKLNNGLEMPVAGIGTFLLSPDEAESSVLSALQGGYRLIDTANAYVNEKAVGRAMKISGVPREEIFLETKIWPSFYEQEDAVEKTLERLDTDYIDFYLLHNVYENSIQVYEDERWKIVDYFAEQKRQGRIRHLGFSCHGEVETLRGFLDYCGDKMEFCQIQLNYLDWTLQKAKEKYELLTERGIGVWVMEPVRGGRLADLSEAENSRLHSMRPDEKSVAWAFRFLQGLPNVKVILSGMSDLTQMVENVETFRKEKPLTDAEQAVLLEIAEGMKNSIPCTACRYCCDGCPQGLDIPKLIAAYNELRFSPAVNVAMRLDALADDKKPSACIGCRKCTRICPQGIDIPDAMKGLAEELSKLPSWAEICRQREEAAKEKRE